MVGWIAIVAARAEELVVGPGGYDTVGDAIAAAVEGDTVHVTAGSWAGTAVVVDRTLTIAGDGGGVTCWTGAAL
ncbi:MAG: hypothetical protein ABMB14_38725, partial [Myxococcota bacterium]